MEKREDAVRARNELSNDTHQSRLTNNALFSRNFRINLQITEPDQTTSSTNTDFNDFGSSRKLKLTGLSKSVNKFMLNKLFSTFGNVGEITISGPLGAAFVTMDRAVDAARAKRNLSLPFYELGQYLKSINGQLKTIVKKTFQIKLVDETSK